MPHADTATGGRSGTLPDSTSDAPARDGEAGNDLDRLREILFGDERDAVGALEARVAALDRTQRDLPARLPVAIERAQQGAGESRMAEALARPVTQALGAAVRENRQVIIDVLFPVIGPAIRKAIAEALRNLVTDVNSAIESSFTPRGIRWRVEAWRSGMPYAQIVLKHTLAYNIDHVFLIERDSGLVLDRESAPHLPELDADAIAGMLTAIGEFVRDSVGRGGSGTLDSARVGEHLLWVIQGPRANLACFIHGVPPAHLHALLEQRLEEIHAQLAGGGEGGPEAEHWRRSLQPDALMRDARAQDRSPAKAPARWPLLIVLLIVLALLGWVIVGRETQNAAIENLRARLGAHPGFVLSGIERRSGGLTVHGLLDPDAEPLDASLRGDSSSMPVTLDTVGYVSTDDSVIARRAGRLLAAPPSVTIGVSNGALALGGHAPAAWVDAVRDRAAWIPGVRRVEFNVARDDDAAASARVALLKIAAEMPERRVTFVRESEPTAESAAVVDAIVAEALRAQSLGASAGVPIAWIAA
ncbi:MAG TPA: hypothetical protein VH375_07890, partial [Rhodanobacteraceae bacterium]